MLSRAASRTRRSRSASTTSPRTRRSLRRPRRPPRQRQRRPPRRRRRAPRENRHDDNDPADHHTEARPPPRPRPTDHHSTTTTHTTPTDDDATTTTTTTAPPTRPPRPRPRRPPSRRTRRTRSRARSPRAGRTPTSGRVADDAGLGLRGERHPGHDHARRRHHVHRRARAAVHRRQRLGHAQREQEPDRLGSVLLRAGPARFSNVQYVVRIRRITTTSTTLSRRRPTEHVGPILLARATRARALEDISALTNTDDQPHSRNASGTPRLQRLPYSCVPGLGGPRTGTVSNVPTLRVALGCRARQLGGGSESTTAGRVCRDRATMDRGRPAHTGPQLRGPAARRQPSRRGEPRRAAAIAVTGVSLSRTSFRRACSRTPTRAAARELVLKRCDDVRLPQAWLALRRFRRALLASRARRTAAVGAQPSAW